MSQSTNATNTKSENANSRPGVEEIEVPVPKNSIYDIEKPTEVQLDAMLKIMFNGRTNKKLQTST